MVALGGALILLILVAAGLSFWKGIGRHLPLTARDVVFLACLFVTVVILARLWLAVSAALHGTYAGIPALAFLFLACYFSGRFGVEVFKAYQTLSPGQWALTMGQWLSIPFALVGFVGFVWCARKATRKPLYADANRQRNRSPPR